MNKEVITKIFDNLIEDVEVKCSPPKSNPSIKRKPTLDEILESDFHSGGGKQVKYQDEVNRNNKFINDDELKSLRDYFSAGYTYINGRIYNTEEWNNLKGSDRELYDEYDKKIPSIIKNINNVIDKAPRLQENTVLWRMGVWDVGMKVGDTGLWKGFTSTSFNENNIGKFKDEGEYKIKILALKGQKGICGDGYTLENWGPQGHTHQVQVQIASFKGENEFLLPTNVRYLVKEVDDVNKTATVVIY